MPRRASAAPKARQPLAPAERNVSDDDASSVGSTSIDEVALTPNTALQMAQGRDEGWLSLPGGDCPVVPFLNMPSIIYRKGMPREEKVGESWEQVASHAKQVVKAKKLEGWKKFQNCCTKTIKTKMNSLIMHMEDQRDREVEGDILHVSGHGAASSALRDLLASVLDSIQAAKSVQDHTDISAL